MDPEKLLSANDLAALMKIGRTTLWRRRKAGTIPPGQKVGSVNLWRFAEVQHLVEK